jgi:beta-glucosidase
MPTWFARYAAHVVPALGDLVDYWLTINEPTVNMLEAYLVGVQPPGHKDIHEFAHALGGYLKAHSHAYHVIHDFFPNAQVGFSHHVRIFQPASAWNPLDRLLSSLIDDLWNNQFLQSIHSGRIHFHVPFLLDYHEDYPGLAGALDFVGMNYYTRNFVRFNLRNPNLFDIVKNPSPKAQFGDLGDNRYDPDEVYTAGMYTALLKMASFGLPIYITENGMADQQDKLRPQVICDTLKQVGHALEDGVDVRSYTHWTLVDDYEWVEGYQLKYGLFALDPVTQARTPRPSAWIYSDIARTGTLDTCGAPTQGSAE